MKMKPVYETIRFIDPITSEIKERKIARPEIVPDYSTVFKFIKIIGVIAAMIAGVIAYV